MACRNLFGCVTLPNDNRSSHYNVGISLLEAMLDRLQSRYLMKTWRRTALLSFLCGIVTVMCVFPSITKASESASPFLQRSWQTDHRLHDSVTAILQTSDGYLWIGTRRGLARFDGVRFTMLEQLTQLNAECIYSLYEDSHRALWIATENGAFRFVDGKLSNFRQSEGLVDDRVRSIAGTHDGSIWFGTAGGLSQWNERKFRNFTEKDGLPHPVVRAISVDAENGVWFATAAGLGRIKDGVVSKPDMPEEWAKAVRFVHVDRQDTVWVGTYMGLFKRTEKGWDHFDKEHFPLSDNFVNTIYSDRSGRLWIGTHGGLNWMEEVRFHTEITGDGAAYDLVNAVSEDREGNFWVGSKEGLTRLRLRPLTAVTKQQGLTYNNVMSVLQDKAGSYWCGTWGGGVFGFHQEIGAVSSFTNLLQDYRILSLCEARDGSLWLGTDHGAGLFRFKDGAFTHYSEAHGLDKIGIPVVYEDHEQNIWVGTSRSLARFQQNKFVHFTKTNGLAGNGVKVIYEDRQNTLWIGTSGGLTCQRNGQFSNFTSKDGLSHEVIASLYADKENTLWIGTAGGGLNRFRDGKFTSYTTGQGLFNDDILEIQEDDDGYLWMSCLKGIFRVRKQDFERFDRRDISKIPCASYGKDDGMISTICCNVAKPASWKANDGRLWFATTKGVVIADPKMKVNETPPPVFVEAVIADKIRINAADSTSISLPPGRGELEIQFTALSFVAPEKNRFKYKLEGFDTDWIDVGSRRFAYYNNLRPGNYRFRVMASNNDGVWATLTTPVNLTLQPHWWQTWSFKVLGIVGSLTVVALVVRFVTRRRMQLKLELLEQQNAIEKERSRIARDMHDDLGACLTQILFLSDVAKKNKATPEVMENQITQISDTTHEVIRNLDAIVWAVNPENDDLERFAGYIEEYVTMFLRCSTVHCRLDFPETLPPIKLSSELRHHLFLAVKEALNNALKYADATEIRVKLSVTNNLLSLDIQDNGKGFVLSEASDFGNGLRNMESRVKSLGGCFAVHAKPGCGTRIHMQIPLTR